MAYGGTIRFSDLLKTASTHPNVKNGCFVDTSILFAESYPPDEFNTEAEEVFEFLAELEIPIFTNVNVRAEFIDLHRRVMIPDALGDLYTNHGKSLDKQLYSKLQSINTSLTTARNTGKPFKFDEQKLLSKGIKSEFLRSIPSNLGHYSSPLMSKFSEISLVDRLKETRVFTGFSRVTRKQNETDFTNMLFKKVPAPHEKWLPAYSVLGEGIYLSLDPSLVHGWQCEMTSNCGMSHFAVPHNI